MLGLPRSLKRGGHLVKQNVTRTKIVIEDLDMNLPAAGSAKAIGSAVIGDFPEGNILLLGAAAYLAFQKRGGDPDIVDTWEGDYAVGSVPNADTTISGAEEDIIPEKSIGPGVAGIIGRTRGVNAARVMLDNTDGSLEINLNVLIDGVSVVDDGTANITIDGEIELVYIVVGDD